MLQVKRASDVVKAARDISSVYGSGAPREERGVLVGFDDGGGYSTSDMYLITEADACGKFCSRKVVKAVSLVM